MLIGLGLTILTAVKYSLDLNGFSMNKFTIIQGNSFQFNWAPMIGIFIMAVGEFLLWQSQHNKNIKEVGIKFLNKIKMSISNLRLDIIYISHLKFVNMKAIRFVISIFHI